MFSVVLNLLIIFLFTDFATVTLIDDTRLKRDVIYFPIKFYQRAKDEYAEPVFFKFTVFFNPVFTLGFKIHPVIEVPYVQL